MYDELLQDVAAFRRESGRDLQPPATDTALADLRRRARSELRYAIPPEYEAFLRKTDGLDSNGISIYGSSRTLIVGTTNRFVSGLVEANLLWRKGGAYEDQVIFANDSLTNYVWHLDDEAWELRTTPSDDLREKVASFEELVFRALDAHKPSRE